jgi:hypothetical protein
MGTLNAVVQTLGQVDKRRSCDAFDIRSRLVVHPH